MKAGMDRLLRPKSIAIVGASPKPTSPGARILGNLTRCGFKGSIFLVNPGRTELEGRPCVPSVSDLPLGIDLAALCVPKAAIAECLRECAAREVGSAVVFASGYAEQDQEGAAEQAAITEIARESNIALLGPNCLGFINAIAGIPVTIATCNPPAEIKPGVGVIAQSGAFMSSLRATFDLKGIPASMLVSVGNQAVLGIEDVLEDMIADPGTLVITIFAERLGEPQRFLELAAGARAARKPIVLMHTGKSNRAREAAQSHTGALAGNYAVMQALLTHESVILVDSLDELADVSALLCRYPTPPTAGVGLVTNSGALRAITFDYCEAAGIDVPELDEATKAAMAKRLPSYAVVENPIDLTVQVLQEPELVGIGGKALVDDPNVGSVVLAVHAGLEAAEYAKHAGPLLANSTKPIAYSVLGEGALVSPELLASLREGNILLFRSVERALGSVAKITAYGRSLLTNSRRPPASIHGAGPGSGVLTEVQGKSWLASKGVLIPKGGLATTIGQAHEIAERIGYPVVLKVQSRNLPHKSDVGGVILGVSDRAALERGWHELHENVLKKKANAVIDGILVEEMAPRGIELVVGMRRDPDWGPILLVGLGGVWIEILNDVRLMPVDLSEAAIAAELGRLRGAKLLHGARGAKPADIDAVARIAALIGSLAAAHPEILEIDINPLIVYEKGKGALALDALVVSAEPDDESRRATTPEHDVLEHGFASLK